MTDDDYEVIWDDTSPHEQPPMKNGDRITMVWNDNGPYFVKVERKRQLPTKFGSVIKTRLHTVLVRVPNAEPWLRADGNHYDDKAVGTGWTLVRDGIES